MHHKHSYYAKALHTLQPYQQYSSSSTLFNHIETPLKYRVEYMRIDSPKSFENNNLGMSFKYPSNQYETISRSNHQTTTIIDLVDRNASEKEMLRITYDVLKQDITPREYISQSLQFVSNTNGHNHRIIEEFQVDVNGAKATQMVIEWKKKGTSFTTSIKHPYQEKTIVVINLWMEDHFQFEKKKEIVRNILHSMIFSGVKHSSSFIYRNESYGFSFALPSSEFKISSKHCSWSSNFRERNVISHLTHSNDSDMIDQEIIAICEEERKKPTLPTSSIIIGSNCNINGEMVKYIAPDHYCQATNQKICYCFFELYFIHDSMYYTIAARCLPSATTKFEVIFCKLIKEMTLFERKDKQQTSILYQNEDCNLKVSIPMKIESTIKESNTTHSCVDIVSQFEDSGIVYTSIYAFDGFVSTMDQLSKRMFTDSATLPAFTLIRNERRKLKDGRSDSHYLVCTFYDKSLCKFLTCYQTSIISKKGNVIVVRVCVAKGSFNPEIEQTLEWIQNSIQII